MGNQLYQIFQDVKDQHGEIELYRLILRTKITLTKSKELPDTDENIERVKQALKELGLTISQLEKRKEEKKQRWWRRLLRRR